MRPDSLDSAVADVAIKPELFMTIPHHGLALFPSELGRMIPPDVYRALFDYIGSQQLFFRILDAYKALMP